MKTVYTTAKNVLAFIGILTILSLLIGGTFLYRTMAEINNKSNVPTCVNDGFWGGVVPLDVLDASVLDGQHLEIAKYVSGFEDKLDVLVLYERKNRSGECIESENVIDSFVLIYGPENGPIEQVPETISIVKNKIKVKYEKPNKDSIAIENISINWK